MINLLFIYTAARWRTLLGGVLRDIATANYGEGFLIGGEEVWEDGAAVCLIGEREVGGYSGRGEWRAY